MTNQYLSISTERFINAYNDYRFVPDVDILAPDSKNPLEYLSWSTATKLLKELFPELVVEFEKNYDGTYVFKEDNRLNKEDAKEDFLQIIEEKKEQLKNTTDWKEKKNIPKEIAEYKAQLQYENRGFYVLPYLIDINTGLKTPSLYFPIMNNTNDPIYNPHSRDVNDSRFRGGVKTISIYTGIGFRLYTREDIDTPDKKLLIKDSPKWIRIKVILDASATLGKEVDKSIVNFGSSERVLGDLANQLIDEIERKNK